MISAHPPRRAGAPAAEGWAEFYQSWLERGQVPAPSYAVVDEGRAVFQGMHLNVAQIQDQVLSWGCRPSVVTVLADVLEVPAGTTLRLTGVAWRLIARRLQVDADCRVELDLRTCPAGEFVLYCAEQSGRVRVVATRRQGPPVVFRLEAPGTTGGVRVGPVDGEVTCQDVTWAQGVRQVEGGWFDRGLRTQLFVACLLCDAHPELALAQFGWLMTWTGYDDRTLDVYLASCSLWTMLLAGWHAGDQEATFVPCLRRSGFGELVPGHVEQARQYESDLRALRSQVVVDQQFIELAEIMAATRAHEGAYADALATQARDDVEDAAAAEEAARRALSGAQRAAGTVAVDLGRAGVTAGDSPSGSAALIDLARAVVAFGVGVASMLAGEHADAAAGDTVAAAVDAVRSVEESAPGGRTAPAAEQLRTTMSRLHASAQALASLGSLGELLITASGDVGRARSLSMTIREIGAQVDGATPGASRALAAYRQAAHAALHDLQVPFSRELLSAVDDIVAQSQTLVAARVAAIAAGQRYTTLRLQRLFAGAQQAQLQHHVESLAAGSAAPAPLLQCLYGRHLVAKAGLLAAARTYRARDAYRTLRPAPPGASLVDGVDRLAAGLATPTPAAVADRSAGRHDEQSPQPMSDIRMIIDDPALLAGLGATGEAEWAISGDAHPFAGFDRVRLTRVRLWLEGARVPEGGSVVVRLSTLGSYEDRRAGRRYRFIARPWTGTFAYRVGRRRDGVPDWSFPEGGFGYVEVDGVVADAAGDGDVQPTPFTRWGIGVRGKDLDLSGMTRLVVQFGGVGTPAAGRSGSGLGRATGERPPQPDTTTRSGAPARWQ